MKFFTSIEFLRSIIITAIASVILGCVYKMANAILIAVKSIFLIPYDVSVALINRKERRLSEQIKISKELKMSTPGLNIFEGVIFTLIGVLFIILLYVALDGVFRFYVFILFASLFILSKNTLGNGAAKIFYLVFRRVYTLIFICLYTLFLPLFLIVLKCIDLFCKVVLIPIKQRIRVSEAKKIKKMKTEEVREIFNKISKHILKTENAT